MLSTRKEHLLEVIYRELNMLVIPPADEVYESEKYADKVWLLLKAIFDIFAMHDVIVLIP